MQREIRIKHMVCQHCKQAVTRAMEALGYKVEEIDLGRAVLSSEQGWDEPALEAALEAEGFSLLRDPDAQLVAEIKTAVIHMIHHRESQPAVKNSIYLSKELNRAYGTLSKVFSRYEGVTLERYIIRQKVERARELISYGEQSLGEIADQLGYSSSQHLSQQFKQVTGMSVSQFRAAGATGRRALNEV